ncbi:ATP-binding cassette domain-containing protein [Granulicella sibirica]|uniref:ATP-binding cassette domain-containing protein n=1 Tax=Granulicella sibirica TaxID=2479048 RepID=UPI001F4F48A4|nr:ATP-binding cassette domain-containing protein [Granulicella sibirica]
MSEIVHRLEVALRHRIGVLDLDVAFTLAKPWTSLFAPSGAGKSTVLRVIAGLVKPDGGRVVSAFVSQEPQVRLTDTATGVFVPPHERNIRFVGQQSALFPHKTVSENVTYGMTSADKSELSEILRICRIEHLLKKMPGNLSGGERQRVSLARALAAGGARALLLDEPFTGLDVALRDAITFDLRAWLRSRSIPVLHVTHDIGEVFSLADEVIRMEGGRVAAQGSPHDVLRAERERLLGLLDAEALPKRSSADRDF